MIQGPQEGTISEATLDQEGISGEIQGQEGILGVTAPGKCIRLLAQNAETNAKSHSNQPKESRFIAEIVLGIKGSFDF